DLADLIVTGKVNDHREPPFEGKIPSQIDEVVAELLSAWHATDRINAAKGVLQLDLRHNYRRQIDQRGHLGRSYLPRLGTQDT
ncbi:hypothetical protein QCD71_24735, partial [Sphingomonas sp. PsM26]|nr:hypothetical protein [Sphingomonas sp. PsM26]